MNANERRARTHSKKKVIKREGGTSTEANGSGGDGGAALSTPADKRKEKRSRINAPISAQSGQGHYYLVKVKAINSSLLLLLCWPLSVQADV